MVATQGSGYSSPIECGVPAQAVSDHPLAQPNWKHPMENLRIGGKSRCSKNLARS